MNLEEQEKIRTLCWVNTLDHPEKTVVLMQLEPYYIDYFTTTYFHDEESLHLFYQKEIKLEEQNDSKGVFAVYKPIKFDYDIATQVLYSKHICDFLNLICEPKFLKHLERVDFYASRNQIGYRRIFSPCDYEDLNRYDDSYTINMVAQKIINIKNTMRYYELMRTILSFQKKSIYDMKDAAFKDAIDTNYVNLLQIGDIDQYVKIKREN